MRSIIVKLVLVATFGMCFGALTASTSCGSGQHPTVGQVAKDCSTVDIGKTIPEAAVTVLGYVLQVFQAGKDGWKNELAKIGLEYGDEVLACASKAARDALAAHPVGTMPAASPAVDRASAFIAEHGWAYK